MTINCPADCSYLISARRYEKEHHAPITADQVPYRDVHVPTEFIRERREIVSGLGLTILNFAAENKSLDDSGAMEALGAMAETYRTLGTGIYYEKPPDGPVPRALYSQLGQYLQDFKKQENERTGFSSLKDSQIFHLLVFLLRVAKLETYERPRSRAFLDFLRAQFPKVAELEKEVSRIVMP
ncbi:MAG: hypothetical protein ACRD4K_02665 [Candidatus Acidiferrales bacterium]